VDGVIGTACADACACAPPTPTPKPFLPDADPGDVSPLLDDDRRDRTESLRALAWMLCDESPRDATGPRDATFAAFDVEDRLSGFPAVPAVAAAPSGYSADPSASGSRARVAFPRIASGPPRSIPPAFAPLAFATVVPFIGARVDFALAPFARPTRPSLRASSIAETPWICRAR
jgi:hypothetical protein